MTDRPGQRVKDDNERLRTVLEFVAATGVLTIMGILIFSVFTYRPL